MNVHLPDDLENYVEDPGFSDVIQEPLRQHQTSQTGFGIVMTPELEKLLDEGMEDPDQAKTTEELRRGK